MPCSSREVCSSWSLFSSPDSGPPQEYRHHRPYSNGTTHPAQARESLARLGFTNVYLLTDGLVGFAERCLEPVSLRTGVLTPEIAAKIAAWRSNFLTSSVHVPTLAQTAATGSVPISSPENIGLVTTDRLADELGKEGLKILDVRAQPEYNTHHIPGSIFLSLESFRGVVGGIPSMLLPSRMLAMHLAQMGILPRDLVVIVTTDKPHDATLAGMVFERLGHTRHAILSGGFNRWMAEKRPVDAVLPTIVESVYKPSQGSDSFTVNASAVMEAMQEGRTIILDVRPEDYYPGKKSDEARAGHIPGAINRPYSEDVVKMDGIVQFKPLEELRAAYAGPIPTTGTRVIVHCRTGHQASQTFFVPRRLLRYSNVLW